MARNWLSIKVDLLGGAGIECDPAPGRILIVGPGHTFEQLAEAINLVFGRYELTHLHEFDLSDGRRIGFPHAEEPSGRGWEDHAELEVSHELQPGDSFEYVFDSDDVWRHRCTVEPELIDPYDAHGVLPDHPVPFPVRGWGAIPDQHGRQSFEG